MKTIKHIFTETGEVKRITDGEFYFRMGDCKSWCDYEPSKDKYRVLTYKRIEEEWKPKYQDNYFYLTGIDIELKVWNDMWIDSDGDDKRWGSGNCFPTKELAEEKLLKIKEILK